MVEHTGSLRTLAVLLAAGVLLPGCAQVKEKPALATIQEELRRAVEAPKPRPLPPAVAAALEPATKVELPRTAPIPLEPRFTLAVNNAPAQQVFLGIASGSRYSMLLHPEVAGSITVSLKDVTVPEAMSAIRELYGYDYHVEGDRILVQPIVAQTRFYSIPYPSSVRQGRSELRVISGSIADSGSSGTSGSAAGAASQLDSSRIVTSVNSDFWGELTRAVGLLIGCSSSAGAPAAVGAGAATAASSASTCPAGRSIVASPSTSMLAVRALPSEQRQVGEYLKAARLQADRQVMIEAKIIEVTLNEGAQTGINWAAFRQGRHVLSKGAATDGLAVPFDSAATATNMSALLASGLPSTSGVGTASGGIFNLALQARNFNALLNFLESQGNVQVLSSPRIAALNNQQAVLKVGTDEFFVTGITSNTSTSGSTTTSSPTLTVQPFFSGIALDVTPQIDDADNIILHVHPSVSVVASSNKDVDLGTLGTYRLPLAASTISETDSIVRLKDGEIAAIGGLMKRQSVDSGSGVPGLGDVPGLGSLFKNTNATRLKHELVILLKPTIIRQQSDWNAGAREAEARLSGGR
ncbi:MAG: pilus (MSHA type) biogenesis protein MshL [Betaproteobacteria bacterium]|nr:pilus (MSHA type) biogenesis protein MshL [Betaproteobacteria bacterium]